MKVLQSLLLTGAALLSFAPMAQAQIQAAPTVVNMNIRSTVDTMGDGEVKLELKMNAQEWSGWKQQYGSNPSLFKRDMFKLFSQYELTDFELEQDDMNRKAVVTIRGKGMAVYQGDGVYELELGKDMSDGEMIDGEYRVTYTEPQGPNTISLINHRITTPEGAKNVEMATSSKGEKVLRYELDTDQAGLPWKLISLIFALVGGGLFLAGRSTEGQAA